MEDRKEITVYEDNRADAPITVTAQQVVERAKEKYPNPLPRVAVNLALADFGTFDPQSDEYREFEDHTAGLLRDKL